MSKQSHLLLTFVLMALIAAYGIVAFTIPLFPGQEDEPFSPRTMPFALAITGVVLCILRVLELRQQEIEGAQSQRNWGIVSALCLSMLIYGLLIVPIGFVLATTFFLFAGFAILGERRLIILFVVPLTLSLSFFVLMTQGLGMYLATGTLFGG